MEAIIYDFAGLRVGLPWNLVMMILSVIVLIFIAVSLFRSGKRGWGWVVISFIFMLLLAIFSAIGKILEYLPDSSSSSWGAGDHGGGFGGGFSGGGGATGGW